jgi:hypothetical protein
VRSDVIVVKEKFGEMVRDVCGLVLCELGIVHVNSDATLLTKPIFKRPTYGREIRLLDRNSALGQPMQAPDSSSTAVYAQAQPT